MKDVRNLLQILLYSELLTLVGTNYFAQKSTMVFL